MPKPSKIKLTIPSPCKEDWNKMAPQGDGRFCIRCTNIIRDFSTFTDRELVAYLSQVKGKVCGQFANTQLNRLIVVTEPSNTPLFRKLLFGAALAAGVASATHSQDLGTPNTGGANASGHITRINVATTNTVAETDSSGVIKGRIIDAKTRHPLPGAKLMVELDSVRYSTAYTDSTGNYSINIPYEYLNKEITLFPRMDDYENTFKTVVISKFPYKISFRLHKSKFDPHKTMGYMMM